RAGSRLQHEELEHLADWGQEGEGSAIGRPPQGVVGAWLGQLNGTGGLRYQVGPPKGEILPVLSEVVAAGDESQPAAVRRDLDLVEGDLAEGGVEVPEIRPGTGRQGQQESCGENGAHEASPFRL